MEEPQPSALVTGASSGIGEVFARKLSQRGYRVLLVARRMQRLERLAAELESALAVPADLTVDRDILRVESLIKKQTGLEFLVNNAGFGVPGPFFEADRDALDRMHRLHVLAVERLTRAALEGMMRRGRGNIVNVSSVAGFFNTLNSTGYCSTKAWINSFSEGLYLEMKHLKAPVRVQALCPGFTVTEFHDVIKMDRSRIAESLWMTPEAVVEDSLRGLEKNRLFVIPGWRYRLFVGLNRFLPRSLRHYIAIKYQYK
ncbi:MAG: SDR family oxidoreductase [Acidobacteria bacterium]|nr:SDR family oxidoreductase [Acidobacteriota bacterium]